MLISTLHLIIWKDKNFKIQDCSIFWSSFQPKIVLFWRPSTYQFLLLSLFTSAISPCSVSFSSVCAYPGLGCTSGPGTTSSSLQWTTPSCTQLHPCSSSEQKQSQTEVQAKTPVELDTLGHLLSCALYIFNNQGWLLVEYPYGHQVGCLWNIFTVNQYW